MGMTIPPWLNTDPAHWNRGVIPQTVHRPVAGPCIVSKTPWEPPDYVWWNYARPVAQQGADPSCAGWMWARKQEYVLGRHLGRGFLPAGVHIDGHVAWVDGREQNYGGDMTGGLTVTAAFRSAVRVGIYPQSAFLREVEAAPDDIWRALQQGPVAAATRVHAGWFELDEHGCLNEWRNPVQGDTGHAWLIVGLLHQGNRYFVSGDTQWGPTYGSKGFFLMSLEELIEGQIAPLYSVVDPDLTWEGWRAVTCRVNERGERMAV